MKPRVYLARPLPQEVVDYISKYCDYRIWDKNERISQNHLYEEVNDVKGLLLSGIPINKELLENAPHLKVVSNVSVGYNNFDLGAMKERRVMGTHTPTVLDETVADLAFALILSAARRIPELDHLVKSGQWKSGNDEPLFGVDVHGKTLGIIGMGRIGETIARRGKYGFNMDVLYYNRHRKLETEAKIGVQYAELEELLSRSDFVVLMIPLTPETVHFMGEAQFEKMKETSIFINTSRGQTVDETALYEALKERKIRAAGLDVYVEEPIPKDHPLLFLTNVVTVPHIGSATYQTRFDMAMLAAQNLVAGVTGKRPPNLVPELADLGNSYTI